MSGAEGFGPVDPAAGGGAPFAISGPSDLALDQKARTGTASFTVSNITGRPVRARLLVQPGQGADAAWFAIRGDAERPLPVAGTATVDVTVTPGERSPAGAATFTLGAALEESPTQIVSSPTVAFEVPPPAKKPFPRWILIVAIVAVLLLAGGGILIFLLTRPDEPEPEPPPTGTPSPAITQDIFNQYDQTAPANQSFDLDAGQVVASDASTVDVSFGGFAHDEGSLSIVGIGNKGLGFVESPTFEACDEASFSIGDPLLIPAGATSFVCVDSTDQERRALITFDPAESGSDEQQMHVVVLQRGE